MAREYTRAQFYDLVWAKPITQVAKDFRLSDVAVHKICRKHAIPTPPPGWWAKKHAGKPVKQSPLPNAAGSGSDRIVIAAPELRAETDAVAKAREAARVRVSDLSDNMEEMADPIVERTIAALRKAEASPKGVLAVSEAGMIHCEVGSASIDRLHRILTRIAAAARIQGFVLEEAPGGAHFAGDGETFSVRVEELVKRVKHVLTPSEQKKEDAWQAKLERQRRRSDWDWDWEGRPVFPEWDYVCTGQLGLELGRVYVQNGQGPRSTFRDAKIQRLEDLVEDISVALTVLAVAKREERARRDEAERIRLEEKRAREQPLREAFVAERRRAGLDAVLADLANLDRLRRLLEGLDGVDAGDRSARVLEFLSWSRHELAEREAAFSVDGLETRFEKDRLFGSDDDHSFKSPYWH